ncbi:hypothetical protein [Bacillus taeanensis]|uniref:Uncharacterized protein n=1 Tax=Bacillus taeanensis TaxID=273032 RepID=A0A366XQQ1_9BACI|nr:hypothetical protein [Bacillus taeanensis]RBW68257.1 hypothetical protein DS031_17955 [Bacillus taeanensis]
MKKATKHILDKFPMLEGKLEAYQNRDSIKDVMEPLNDVEETFLKLVWFFENPEDESFHLGWLYRDLDDDWLEFALELIAFYFREDTYLIKNPSFSLIREGDDYLNQTQFAGYLVENRLKYDRVKLNVYMKRGKIPKPDIKLSGQGYWSKSTVERFCEQEKERLF